MVRDEMEARMVFQKLSDVANRFLCVSLDYRGFVPNDLNLRQSNRNQELVAKAFSKSPSSVAISQLAENFKNSERFMELKGGLQFFWNQLSGVA
jgi:flagellar biosynthesis protein FlhG